MMDVDLAVDQSQDDLLNHVLDAIVYSDKQLKDITHSTLKLIDDSRSRLGEASASFVEAILWYNMMVDPIQVLSDIEENGCHHPLLYRYLAQSHSHGDRRDDSKVFEYCDKAASGTSCLALSNCCMT